MLVHDLIDDFQIFLLSLSKVRTFSLELFEFKAQWLVSWHLNVGCSSDISHLSVALVLYV